MQDFLISRINSFSLDTKGISPGNLLERSRKDFSYIPNSKTLVVCLPSWGQNLWSWGMAKAHITNSGASFLTYKFPREILSNQKDLTIECFEMINQTVRRDIKQLKEQYGFNYCVVAGLSLANSFASMVYKDNVDINEVVLVVPGENIARDMWYGCRTQHLRRSYVKQGISLEELDVAWRGLSAEYNMPAPGTKISLHMARQDKVVPYWLSKSLSKTLEKNGFEVKTRVYYLCGHYVVSVLFLLFPQWFIKLSDSSAKIKA